MRLGLGDSVDMNETPFSKNAAPGALEIIVRAAPAGSTFGKAAPLECASIFGELPNAGVLCENAGMTSDPARMGQYFW
jgi:hypothetical protein